MSLFTFNLTCGSKNYHLNKTIVATKKPSTMAAFLDALHGNDIEFDIIVDNDTEFFVSISDDNTRGKLIYLAYDLFFVFNPKRKGKFSYGELTCFDNDHNENTRISSRGSYREEYRYGYLVGFLLNKEFDWITQGGYPMVSVYSPEPNFTVTDVEEYGTIMFRHLATDVKLNIHDFGVSVFMDSQLEYTGHSKNFIDVVFIMLDDVYT